MNSSVKSVLFWLVIVTTGFLLWQTVKSGERPPSSIEISYSEFLNQTESGNIQKVVISGTRVDGQYRDGRSFRLTAPASQDGMLRALHDKSVEIWFTGEADGSRSAWLLNIAPLVLLAALWFFMIRQMKQRQTEAKLPGDFPR